MSIKFYFIKYTDSVPKGFAGTTYGPLIRIRPQYVEDKGLLEHEKIHVRQWYKAAVVWLLLVVLLSVLVSSSFVVMTGLAPLVHTLLYKYVRPYRCACEVQAYRRQIAIGGYASTDFASMALAEKYDLGLTNSMATELLFS